MADERVPHEPVMADEVVELLLAAASGGGMTVLDMTVGAGGHASALLDRGIGRVVGIDRDEGALEVARMRLAGYGDRFRAEHRRFSQVGEAGAMGPLHGVLFDL